MARRGPTMRAVKCSRPDCGEYTHREFANQAEYAEDVRRNRPWFCVRHTGIVLSPECPVAEWISEPNTERFCSLPSARTQSIGFYFDSTNLVQAGNIKVFAADFPAGSRVRITVEVLSTQEPRP